MAYAVILEGGSPWGFRLYGGLDFNEPLKIGKLNPNSKAYNQGVAVGDYLDKINGTPTSSIQHNDALQLIRNANNKLELELRRGETKKKSVIPEIRINGPVSESSSQSNGNLSDSDYYYSSCDEEGIVRTNAITNYHSSSGSAGSAGHQSDGDGSSSGSQSSVVHVVSPYKGPLADKMKNISNLNGPGPGNSDGRATPQTTVWSPFGVNKVRAYKPVSFSALGGVSSATSSRDPSPAGPTGGSTTPVSQKSSAFNTAPSFANATQNVANTQQNATQQNFSGAVSPTSERRELGSNQTSASCSTPSYSNFNGSTSVVVSSDSKGSSYTSITMNSRKVPDPSPTHQFTRYGSPIPPSSPAQSRPFSPQSVAPPSGVMSPPPTQPLSPTKVFTPNVSVKSTVTPISPVKAPLGAAHQSTNPVRPAFRQSDGPALPRPMSPTKPNVGPYAGFKLGSPPKPMEQAMKPVPVVSNFSPLSPKKSSLGPFPGSPQVQRRPMSPTKTVTFGPVTSLEEKSQETTETEEPEIEMSVSQKKSLFEQNKPQQPPEPPKPLQQTLQPSQPCLQPKRINPPATAPKQFGHAGGLMPFKTSPKINPPSNITPGAIYRPVSPHMPPKQVLKTSPYTPPKSPTLKSKGLEMFLTLQKKLHEPEDDVSEFTDSEDVPMPKPVTVVTPTKPVPPSPVIGRAMPMKMNSQVKDVSRTSNDLSLNNSDNSISTYPGIKPLTPTSPTKSASWVPSQATTLIDKELEYRERERLMKREQERERERLHEKEAEFNLRNTPTQWGSTGNSALSKSDLNSMHLDQNQLTKPETVMRCESPSQKVDERFSWKPERATTFSSATLTTTTTTTTATHHTPSSTMSYSSHNGSISHHKESRSGLPVYQSPTITLLQKSRELKNSKCEPDLDLQSVRINNISELKSSHFDLPRDLPAVRIDENDVPKEAILVGTKETIEGDKKHMDTYYLLPGSKEANSKPKRIVDRKTSKYEGIGPVDEQTGIPIIPRGSVDERAHKDWYKRMYKSLHKLEKPDGDINTYQPTYVFPEEQSESESEEFNPYRPTYEFSAFSDTEGPGSTMSMDRAGYGKQSFTLPNARYRNDKYKVQPMSIENYEPGFSSIAFRERKANDKPRSPELQNDKKSQPTTDGDKNPNKKSYLYNPPVEKPGQFSKYIYSDSEPNLKKTQRPLSPQSDVEKSDTYKRIQRGGEIPYEGLQFPIPPKKEHSRASTQNNVPRQRHSVSGTGRSPTGSWDSRRRRDEEAARRKEEMRRVTAEERLKRMEIERRSNAARRHNDFLTEYIKDKLDDKYWLQLAGVEHDEESSPSQKSPIPLNRYDDEPDVSSLQRPTKKVGAQFRGKARALYNFTAQNTKELSFRKNDAIFLLRQIDKNWYEGEHHGLVGIFPVNYVDVLMSLDEARQAAILREGQARAKHSFTAQSGTEVSFRKGDTLNLIRRIDNNWFEGRVDGKHGIFPVSYVEVLCEPDTPLPTPMSSYAPTPNTGSPGQLSPVSTISNGPAPTIPSAPISPRSSVDNFDFAQPFSFQQYPSASASLQRGSGRDHSYADYGLDPLNMMRPASALGGPINDSYSSLSRDRYNRPSSAVPFTDYSKQSTRDSGFYSSEESKHSRQKQREHELMRSLSNPYEGRQSSYGRQHDDISKQEEPRYPLYKALYTYRPQNADELELREGDVVYVMERCDDDWYVGTSERTKEFGTFPGNYVKPL